MNYLRLMRYKNLLIIACLQYVVRWLIIFPVIHEFGFEFQISEPLFLLLVLSTLAITAGGYVINDYFDRPTDLVNRPHTVIVGRAIKRRSAMVLHLILNIIGIGAGTFVSWKAGIIEAGAVYLVIAGLLWYYSTTYKRQFLIGNFIVAILTALVPLIVVIYEIPLLNNAYIEHLEEGYNFNFLFFYVLVVSLFAFMTTLIREIIKDIEDMEGDNVFERNTLPIIAGVKTSKLIVQALILITVLALIFVYYRFNSYLVYIPAKYTILYIIFMLIIPFAFLAYKLEKASTWAQYHFAANFSKIIMLIGILYFVYRVGINHIIG